MTPEGTDERLDAMQATIDELRAEVAALRAVGAQGANGDPMVSDEPVSRRHALRAAGVLAAGAIAGGAGVLASATPAAATTGTFDGLVVTSGVSSPSPLVSVSTAGPWAIAVSATGPGRGVQIQSSDAGLEITADRAPLHVTPGGDRPRVRVAAPSFTSYRQGDIVCDSSGDLWFCSRSTTSLVVGSITYRTAAEFRKISGPSSAGAFHAITPGRVHDSRPAAGGPGVITTGQNRSVSVANRVVSDGVPAMDNFIPEGATAISANVTVTGTGGSGYLAINRGGDTTPRGSIINWGGPGLTIANGVTLALDSNRALQVICRGPAGASTNFIIDVLGYWM